MEAVLAAGASKRWSGARVGDVGRWGCALERVPVSCATLLTAPEWAAFPTTRTWKPCSQESMHQNLRRQEPKCVSSL